MPFLCDVRTILLRWAMKGDKNGGGQTESLPRALYNLTSSLADTTDQVVLGLHKHLSLLNSLLHNTIL